MMEDQNIYNKGKNLSYEETISEMREITGVDDEKKYWENNNENK